MNQLHTPHDFAIAATYLEMGAYLDESVSILGLRDGNFVQCSTLNARASQVCPVRFHFDRIETPGVVIVGKGSSDQVRSLMSTLVDAAHARELDTLSLRIHQGRYWSDACQDCDVCPSDGHEIDPTASLDIIKALWERDTLRPVPRPLMDHATKAFQPADITPQVQEAIADQGPVGHTDADAKATFVTHAIDAEARGSGPQDSQFLARLIVLMRDRHVPSSIIPSRESAPTHVALWTRVTAAATGADRATPAYLTAVAAWITGDLITAHAAVEEALRADPAYTEALRMQRALTMGLPVERIVSFPPTPTVSELPTVEVPQVEAWGYCEAMQDGEPALYENSTCVEYDAMMQLLDALSEAGMRGLTQRAQEHQTEAHVSTSHVPGDQCRSVPQLAPREPGYAPRSEVAPLIPGEVAGAFCAVMARETYTNALYARRSTCLEWIALRELLRVFQEAGVPYVCEAMRIQRRGHSNSGMCMKDCHID